MGDVNEVARHFQRVKPRARAAIRRRKGTLTFDASRFHAWYADFGQAGAENWWANKLDAIVERKRQ